MSDEKKISVNILPSECSLIAAALVLKAAQIGRQRVATDNDAIRVILAEEHARVLELSRFFSSKS